VLLIRARRHGDARGFFYEAWNESAFAALGIDAHFVQDNHSRSARGVLRGMHWQDMTAPLGKLVRCTAGRIFDAVVDLRLGSPTFGHHFTVTLDADDASPALLWVPTGFAHGFLCVSESAEVQYKVTGPWAPAAEGCLAWDDPEVAIPWPGFGGDGESPSLSERDRRGMSLATYRTAPSFRYATGGKGVS
jgi:dTDP-4-dehydrorhamnose 3,5-epimerase